MIFCKFDESTFLTIKTVYITFKINECLNFSLISIFY